MTSDIERCRALKDLLKNIHNNKVVNPWTDRKIDITKTTFRKKKQLCKDIGIDLDALSQSETTSDTFNNTESFAQLEKTIRDEKLDINECIEALLKKNTKGKNDSENNKREYLLTILHKDNINSVNDEYKKYYKEIKKIWFELWKDNFDIDISNSDTNFSIIKASNKKHHYYDLRAKYTKNNKIYQKRIEFKFMRDVSSIHELPQLADLFYKSVKLFNYKEQYPEYFFKNYFQKMIEIYNRHSKNKITFSNNEDKTKQYLERIVYDMKCTEIKSKDDKEIKAILANIVLLRKNKNGVKAKKELDECVQESISNYFEIIKEKSQTIQNILNISENDEIKKKLYQQRHKHFIIWNREGDKNFNFTYTRFPKSLIDKIYDSINNNNFEIKHIQKKPRIVIFGDENYDLHLMLAWKNHNGICNPYIKLSINKSRT